MFLFTPYDLARSKVIYIQRAEERLWVARSERGKAFQVVVQFLGNILEVDNRINIQYGFTLFRLDVFLDISLETSALHQSISLSFRRHRYVRRSSATGRGSS